MLSLRQAALLLALPLIGGCGRAEAPPPVSEEGAEAYTVRGVYQGSRFEGAAASVEHEAIPGVMDAMRMDFRLTDPTEVEDLSPGDKVEFELIMTDRGAVARGFERLPDTTQLAVPSAEADIGREVGP